jgi:hypothetical protein
VSWKTVFLLASLIPLGLAVETSGTAAWIADQTLTALGDVPIWVIQAALAVLATFFTLVMSNVGATVLLVPLAVNMALGAGANPAVFALTVAIATSNSFLIPTHQVNALIMGPGGYRVPDYMRAGGIMTVLFLVVIADDAESGLLTQSPQPRRPLSRHRHCRRFAVDHRPDHGSDRGAVRDGRDSGRVTTGPQGLRRLPAIARRHVVTELAERSGHAIGMRNDRQHPAARHGPRRRRAACSTVERRRCRSRGPGRHAERRYKVSRQPTAQRHRHPDRTPVGRLGCHRATRHRPGKFQLGAYAALAIVLLLGMLDLRAPWRNATSSPPPWRYATTSNTSPNGDFRPRLPRGRANDEFAEIADSVNLVSRTTGADRRGAARCRACDLVRASQEMEVCQRNPPVPAEKPTGRNWSRLDGDE